MDLKMCVFYWATLYEPIAYSTGGTD